MVLSRLDWRPSPLRRLGGFLIQLYSFMILLYKIHCLHFQQFCKGLCESMGLLISQSFVHVLCVSSPFYEADFIALRSQLTLPTKPTSSDNEVNSIFEGINRDCRLMFSICVKQRPIPSLCWKNRSMLLHSAQNSPIMLAESEFAVTVLMNLLS